MGVFEAPISAPRGRRYATMEESIENVVPFPDGSSKDVLDEILREGARRLLTRAIETDTTESAWYSNSRMGFLAFSMMPPPLRWPTSLLS